MIHVKCTKYDLRLYARLPMRVDITTAGRRAYLLFGFGMQRGEQPLELLLF